MAERPVVEEWVTLAVHAAGLKGPRVPIFHEIVIAARRGGDEALARMSYAKIVYNTGFSIQTVIGAVRALEAAGLITVQHIGRRYFGPVAFTKELPP